MTRAQKKLLAQLAVTALGGAAGTLVTRLLARLGLEPKAAAFGVAVAGAVGAATTRGLVQHAAAGVAAAGVGELAVRWFDAIERRIRQGRGQAHPAPAQPADRAPRDPVERVRNAVARSRAVRRPAAPRATCAGADAPPREPRDEAPNEVDDRPLIIKEPIGSVRSAA